MGTKTNYGDIIRYISMAFGVGLMGFTAAILQSARKFRAPTNQIYLAAISYIVLIGFSIGEVYSHLGEGFGWRAIVALFAYGFGWFAMYEMWKYYRPKARALRHGQIATARAGELLEEARRKLIEESVVTAEGERVDEEE